MFGRVSQDFHWHKKWDTLEKTNFDKTKGPVSIEWFIGSKTNLAYNSIDRHVKVRLNMHAFTTVGQTDMTVASSFRLM